MNLDNFTIIAQKSLKQGSQIANIQKHQQIENGHILKGIFSIDKTISSYLLKKCGIDIVTIEDLIDKIIASYVTLYSGKLSISSHVEKTISKAKQISNTLNDSYISIEHLLYGIIDSNDGVAALLNNKGATSERFVEAIKSLRSGVVNEEIDLPLPYTKRLTQNLLEKVNSPNYLSLYSRDDKVSELIAVLSQMNNKYPVLIGESGSGKSSLVENMAATLMKGNVPSNLLNRPLLILNSFTLLYEPSPKDSLLKLFDELESSDKNPILFIDDCDMLFDTLKESNLDSIIILLNEYISQDAFQIIFATTLAGYTKFFDKSLLISALISPLFLTEPDHKTTIKILKKSCDRLETYHQVLIDTDAIDALVHLAGKYFPEQPLPGSAITLLDKAASALKQEINILPPEIADLEIEINNLKIEKEHEEKENPEKNKELIHKFANLSDKRNKLKAAWEQEKKLFADIASTKEEIYFLRKKTEKDALNNNFASISEIKHNSYPQAEEKLSQLIAKFKELAGSSVIYNRMIDADYIARIVADESGISVRKLMQTTQDKLLNLENGLKNIIAGQDKALKLISSAIKRNKAGLNSQKGFPTGRFIFTGAKSCGRKTTAKALASLFFGTPNKFHNINLSLFRQSENSLADCKNHLYDIMNDGNTNFHPSKIYNPECVVLFENFEKTSTDVRFLIERIFTIGQLSDNERGTIVFKNSVLLVLCNNTHQIFGTAASDSNVKLRQNVFKTLTKSSLSTVADNVDEVVIFKPFGFNEIYKLVVLQFDSLKNHLQASGIEIEITKNALSWLAKAAYAPGNGGKVVSQVLRHYIYNELSDRIITGTVEREKTILINCNSSGATFTNIETENIEKELTQKSPQKDISPSNEVIQKFQINESTLPTHKGVGKLRKTKLMDLFNRKKND